ncbi:MAG: LTA synthase family protein [Clostridia bacterium]|nr:LTA synthase family protein [Clostridia bacterium]
MKKALKVFGNILICILIVFSFLAFNSAGWYLQKYGDVGFDAILFTLFSNTAGVEQGLIRSYLACTIPITILFSSIIIFLLFYNAKNKLVLYIRKFKICIFPFKRIFSKLFAVILSLIILLVTANNIKVFEFIDGKTNPSLFYEENYVDPENVKITFPENKRNLIYIFIESMETTYFSVEEGGAIKTNVVPELYSLANENINFSNNNGVGGAYVLPGATWTIAATVAQTAGITLNLPVKDGNSLGKNREFMPNLYGITDILHNNGYYQSFMCGSDADFGSRRQYYLDHGVDKIFDYYTAMDDGIIAKDFHDGWWGISDYDLYDYAKQELPKIASKNKPFAFFMLTVDTHHLEGNVCPKCDNKYAEQYENVFSCASKQMGDFINWAKSQDFYVNTTFVIVGDHNSMNMEYVSRNVYDGYDRMLYNAYINSAISTEFSKNREFSQVDFFPTTLAALGCEIDGDALGLGVNLFSGKKTLAEEYGIQYFSVEIMKKSKLYNNKFLDMRY